MDEPLADELAAKETEEPVTDLGPTVLLRRGSFWGGLLSWFLAACSLYLWLVMTIFGLVQASVEESTFPLLFLLLAVVFFAYGWFNIFGRFDVRQHGLCYRKWGGPITVRNGDVVRIGYIVQRKALLGITLEVHHCLRLCVHVHGRDRYLSWRFTAQYPDEEFNQIVEGITRRLAERWM